MDVATLPSCRKSMVRKLPVCTPAMLDHGRNRWSQVSCQWSVQTCQMRLLWKLLVSRDMYRPRSESICGEHM